MEEKKVKAEKNIAGEIEALLFASGEPVKISKLAHFLKMSQAVCQKKLNEINETYRKNNQGLSLVFKANDVQLVSSAEFGGAVADFLDKELSEDLSRAASEVLAVIAYRGPISRAEIEYIRGVNCSFTLRNLAIRGLIERSENPNDNRAYLYEISFDFLKSLGLSRVEELTDYSILKQRASTEKDEGEVTVAEEQS